MTRFGLIPSKAKEDKISRNTYNARSETAAEKSSPPPLHGAIEQLMLKLDSLNRRFGRCTVKVSTHGAFCDWEIRQQSNSPHYTTAWNEVPLV